MKEVRIKLRSVRFTVEAALFSDEENTEIFRELEEIQPETVEINTVGSLSCEGGRVELSYEETEVTGMEGTRTLLTYLEGQENIVSILREGEVTTALVFEEGKRHHCVYNTPYMPFQICTHTLKIDNRLLSEKYIELDYIVEIRGAMAERTRLRMELL